MFLSLFVMMPTKSKPLSRSMLSQMVWNHIDNNRGSGPATEFEASQKLRLELVLICTTMRFCLLLGRVLIPSPIQSVKDVGQRSSRVKPTA